MFSKISSVFLLAFLVSQFSLSAWWDMGHMAVAQIAYEELQPEVRSKVDAYLKEVADAQSPYADFVMASVWADDAFNAGLKLFAKWHISPYPYDPEGVLTAEEEAVMTAMIKSGDMVWAMGQCIDTLQKANATDWAKGWALRLLIHLAADLHQPNHCLDYFSADFPKGDRGGTNFPIQHEKYKNLHQLFDAAFGLCDRMPERPMNEADRLCLQKLVAYLRAKHPRREFVELGVADIDQWRQETYNLGATFAYRGVAPHEPLSYRYVEAGKIVTGRQLALAGYRLSSLLNNLLGE